MSMAKSRAIFLLKLQGIQARNVLLLASPSSTPTLLGIHYSYHAREIRCALVLNGIYTHADALLTVVTSLLLKLHVQ